MIVEQLSQEDIPVSIRIQLSQATVKALHTHLQHAYRKDDMRLVRRITVLLDMLVHDVPVAVLHERWGVSPAGLYAWRRSPRKVDPEAEKTSGRVA